MSTTEFFNKKTQTGKAVSPPAEIKMVFRIFLKTKIKIEKSGGVARPYDAKPQQPWRGSRCRGRWVCDLRGPQVVQGGRGQKVPDPLSSAQLYDPHPIRGHVDRCAPETAHAPEKLGEQEDDTPQPTHAASDESMTLRHPRPHVNSVPSIFFLVDPGDRGI